MNKKSLFVVIISALTIMVSLTYQGTYSYFTSSVEGTGNIENNTSTTNTEELSDLIITNGENISNTTMIPGDSVTITFSVQNPNDIKVCFDLLWNNTTNEFVNQQDLVYTLEDEDGTMLVSETQYPSTNTGTTLLVDGTSIEANETKTYTLTITYKETDEDQTADIGKTFNSTIIGELGECYVPPSFNEELLACNDTAANCLKNNASLNTVELAYDNTTDNNLRYIGANPNNYVTFNNELWRIIGVFNNIDNGTGTIETRLKIIRNEPIGEYSWDNKPDGTGSSINWAGSNNWSDSRLMMLLNPGYEEPNSPIYEYEGSLYYNGKSGTCYTGRDRATVSCDFTDTGLKSIEAKEMIGNAIWNLGRSSTYDDVTASMFYEKERGTKSKWTGKIALMYPSDYGYATSGGSTTNRETCLNTALYNWDNYDDCYNNDWLYKSRTYQWTLTSYSSTVNSVFYVDDGLVSYNNTHHTNGVSPALYLNSNVKISGGEGTEESPYTLSL